MRYVVGAAILLLGCTRPSPDYVGDGDPTQPGGVPVANSDGSGRTGVVGASGLDGGVRATVGQDLGGASSTTPDLAAVDLSPSTSTPGSCDPAAQTGCAAGLKCVPAAGGSLCLPASTPVVPLGALCGQSANPPTPADLCAPGTFCMTSGPIAKYSCHQQCSADADCTPNPSGGLVAPLCEPVTNDPVHKWCSSGCNPVHATDGTNGCVHGLACNYFFDKTRNPPLGYEMPSCTGYGSGGTGADCSVNNTYDCAPGLVCVNLTLLGAGRICQPVCATTADCPGGTQCTAFIGAATTVYGYCF